MIEERIRRFISDDLGWTGGTLADDHPLIESHVIDSLGIYELVGLIEREYGVQVLDEEVVPSNLGTIASIVRFIESKRVATA